MPPSMIPQSFAVGSMKLGENRISVPEGLGVRPVSFTELNGLEFEVDFVDYITQIATGVDDTLRVIQGMENRPWRVIWKLKQGAQNDLQVGFDEEILGLYRLAENDSSSLVLIPHVRDVVEDPKYPIQGMIILDKEIPFIMMSLPSKTDIASLPKFLTELRRLEETNGCFYGILSDKYFLGKSPFDPSAFLQNQLIAFEMAFCDKRNI